jgi:heme/copper-type cytochrome/quinol oxidase subunit 3
MTADLPRRSPFSDRTQSAEAGWLGLRLFLVSLAILFSVPLIGYWVIRLAPATVGHADLTVPPLPRGLWVSTAAILGASATIHLAVGAARRGRDRGAVATWTAATLALGVTFLLIQAGCWITWMSDFQEIAAASDRRFVLAAFYVLTGLHAVHVIGGLVPLGVAAWRAMQGRYGPDDHAGLRLCAWYWHFLDAVWLAVFVTLMLGSL